MFYKERKKKEYKEIIIKTYQKNKIYPHFLKSEKLSESIKAKLNYYLPKRVQIIKILLKNSYL